MNQKKQKYKVEYRMIQGRKVKVKIYPDQVYQEPKNMPAFPSNQVKESFLNNQIQSYGSIVSNEWN